MNLVGDEERVVASGEITSKAKEIGIEGDDAAFTKDGLENHAGRVTVESALKSGAIVRFNKGHFRREGSEGSPVVGSGR